MARKSMNPTSTRRTRATKPKSTAYSAINTDGNMPSTSSDMSTPPVSEGSSTPVIATSGTTTQTSNTTISPDVQGNNSTVFVQDVWVVGRKYELNSWRKHKSPSGSEGESPAKRVKTAHDGSIGDSTDANLEASVAVPFSPPKANSEQVASVEAIKMEVKEPTKSGRKLKRKADQLEPVRHSARLKNKATGKAEESQESEPIPTVKMPGGKRRKLDSTPPSKKDVAESSNAIIPETPQGESLPVLPTMDWNPAKSITIRRSPRKEQTQIPESSITKVPHGESPLSSISETQDTESSTLSSPPSKSSSPVPADVVPETTVGPSTTSHDPDGRILLSGARILCRDQEGIQNTYIIKDSKGLHEATPRTIYNSVSQAELERFEHAIVPVEAKMIKGLREDNTQARKKHPILGATHVVWSNLSPNTSSKTLNAVHVRAMQKLEKERDHAVKRAEDAEYRLRAYKREIELADLVNENAGKKPMRDKSKPLHEMKLDPKLKGKMRSMDCWSAFEKWYKGEMNENVELHARVEALQEQLTDREKSRADLRASTATMSTHDGGEIMSKKAHMAVLLRVEQMLEDEKDKVEDLEDALTKFWQSGKGNITSENAGLTDRIEELDIEKQEKQNEIDSLKVRLRMIEESEKEKQSSNEG